MLTPKLFEPIEIAGLHVKNRITMPPMHTNLGNMEIGITDEGIDFYVARARGGFGLIGIGIIDAYYVANAGSPLEYFLQNERHVKQYAGLVKQLKKYDCLPYAQIGVRRLFPVKQLHRKDRPTLAHFAVEIIEEMIEAVVLTAVRAAEAGFEAVDILGVGGSAHSIFLSQVFNDRTDRWGGSPEGRLRFALETIGGIKKALGNDFPVFYRLHGSEFLEGGYGLETAIQNARALEAAGVGYFNVTGGGHATSVPQLTPNVPRDAYAFLACEIKKSVNVPVAASNRNNDPFSVEALLRTGWADLVSLGRQALADADWPNKVRAGDYGAIRRCIACNECLDITVIFDRPVHCLVNPRQGLISEVQPVPAAETPKKVVVVGGGISGLQAALTSAERGHRVILVEKTSSLGGMWNHASYPPGREELFSFLQWLVHQANRAGVEFRLDTEASEKSLAALQPDVIVVSAGVEAAPIEIPHAEGTPLHHAVEALQGSVAIGERVVIVGGGGIGVEVALYLARRWTLRPEVTHFLREYDALENGSPLLQQRGHQVTLTTRWDRVGGTVGGSTKWVLAKELAHAGVNVVNRATAKEIKPDGVVIEREGKQEFVPADTVLVAGGLKPNLALFDALKKSALAPEIHSVGNPKFASHAVHTIKEAYQLALRI